MDKFQVVFPVPGSDYNDCIILQKYGDQYKLVAGIRPEDPTRTPFMKWAYPQVGKKGDNRPGEKAVPVQITLGNIEDARLMLQKILAALPATPQQQARPQPPPQTRGNIDIPW